MVSYAAAEHNQFTAAQNPRKERIVKDASNRPTRTKRSEVKKSDNRKVVPRKETRKVVPRK